MDSACPDLKLQLQPKRPKMPQFSQKSRRWLSAETLGDTGRERDCGFIGGDEGIRTLDLLSASQALFRAELRPHPREGYCTTANGGKGTAVKICADP